MEVVTGGGAAGAGRGLVAAFTLGSWDPTPPVPEQYGRTPESVRLRAVLSVGTLRRPAGALGTL